MKVIIFSRFFPKGHPKAGQPTFFVEKIMAGLADCQPGWKMNDHFTIYNWHEYYNCTWPKHHTIRAGNRWKPGDMASLRVWSEKAYRSKQIEFAQVEVKKVWEFNLRVIAGEPLWQLPGVGSGTFDPEVHGLKIIAANDALTVEDFINWFTIHPKKKDQVFSGQIICWSDKINY
jgi:hypothetical protein